MFLLQTVHTGSEYRYISHSVNSGRCWEEVKEAGGKYNLLSQ